MIRAISLDIDGTITDQNRRLDISSVGAVRKAEDSNIPICLATGNILCFARATSVLLGTSGPLIAEDGGVIFDQRTKREYVLDDKSDELEKGIKILEDEFGKVEHTLSSLKRRTGRAFEKTFDVKKASKIFREKGLSIVAIDSGFAIHIKDPTINKGKALKKIASILGISPSEIAAIGDAQNDLEMLKSASISFALANACPEAKEISTHTTKNVHGEGVNEAIELILQEND